MAQAAERPRSNLQGRTNRNGRQSRRGRLAFSNCSRALHWHLYAMGLWAFSVLALSSACFAASSKHIEKQVRAITKSAILIDTHNDVPSFTVDGYDLATPTPRRDTDLPRLREGGVGAVFFAAFVDSSFVEGNHSANRALKMIDTIRHDIVAGHPSDFLFATTAKDIVEAHRKHKIAALIGIEGGHAIEDSPRLLRDYYALGVRYMTLTHTNTNNWADSSGDMDTPNVQRHIGLTPLGKQIVNEMNRLGMLVDISHTADKTFWTRFATSRAPLIASHSSCRALTDVPRNMTDDMIKALAAKGGVIQINFNCGFISQKVADFEKTSPMKGRYLEIIKQYKDDPKKQQEELDKLIAEAKSNRPPGDTRRCGGPYRPRPPDRRY